MTQKERSELKREIRDVFREGEVHSKFFSLSDLAEQVLDVIDEYESDKENKEDNKNKESKKEEKRRIE